MKLKLISFAILIAFSNQVASQSTKSPHTEAKKSYKNSQASTYTSNDLVRPSKVTMDFVAAYYSGNLEIAGLLLRQGADINCPNCNLEGITPLINTVQNPASSFNVNPNLVWLIDHGADVNVKNKKGETPLMISVKNVLNDFFSGMNDTLFLMNNGAKTDIKDNSGKNSLHHLAKQGVVPIGAGGWLWETTKLMNERYEVTVKNLLKSNVNINDQDATGNTALIYAAATCNPSTVNFYLSNGADKNLKNNLGESALDVAMSNAIAKNDKFCNETVSILK